MPEQESKPGQAEQVDQKLRQRIEDTKERVDRTWNPERYQALTADLSGSEILQNAEAKGERIVEVPVTITVRIPERRVFDNEYWPAIDNLIHSATHGANIKGNVIRQLAESFPEAIAAAKQVEINSAELTSMLSGYRSSDDRPAYGDSTTTGLFDYERAKQLVAQTNELRKQFGAPDPYNSQIVEMFEKAGYPLMEAETEKE